MSNLPAIEDLSHSESSDPAHANEGESATIAGSELPGGAEEGEESAQAGTPEGQSEGVDNLEPSGEEAAGEAAVGGDEPAEVASESLPEAEHSEEGSLAQGEDCPEGVTDGVEDEEGAVGTLSADDAAEGTSEAGDESTSGAPTEEGGTTSESTPRGPRRAARLGSSLDQLGIGLDHLSLAPRSRSRRRARRALLRLQPLLEMAKHAAQSESLSGPIWKRLKPALRNFDATIADFLSGRPSRHRRKATRRAARKLRHQLEALLGAHPQD